MENDMKKKYKRPLLLLVILIILIMLLMIFKLVFHAEKNNEQVKVVDSIDNFGYTLDKRDSKLMKEKYQELKKIVSSKTIDYEKYASVLSELFVIDLFSMQTKINKYDVGSLEYVYPDNIDNFALDVQNTIYKTMVDNSDGKRTQSLPMVSKTNVTDITKDSFEIGEEKVDAYKVSLSWEYEKNLGYDDKATITLVAKNNKLYVVEYSKDDSNE